MVPPDITTTSISWPSLIIGRTTAPLPSPTTVTSGTEKYSDPLDLTSTLINSPPTTTGYKDAPLPFLILTLGDLSKFKVVLP